VVIPTNAASTVDFPAESVQVRHKGSPDVVLWLGFMRILPDGFTVLRDVPTRSPCAASSSPFGFGDEEL
jgi:hypothetical protein